MGIALLSIHSLCNAVDRWFNPPRATLVASSTRSSSAAWRARSRIDPQQWGVRQSSLPSAHVRSKPSREGITPLKVLRLREEDTSVPSAGRIRISGRMADVCAELDRLIAKEAQNLAH